MLRGPNPFIRSGMERRAAPIGSKKMRNSRGRDINDSILGRRRGRSAAVPGRSRVEVPRHLNVPCDGMELIAAPEAGALPL
jgi:hypothetical protein